MKREKQEVEGKVKLRAYGKLCVASAFISVTLADDPVESHAEPRSIDKVSATTSGSPQVTFPQISSGVHMSAVSDG